MIYCRQIILSQPLCLSDEITGIVDAGRAIIVIYFAFSVDFHICRRNWKKCGRYGEEDILKEGRDWICGLQSG